MDVQFYTPYPNFLLLCCVGMNDHDIREIRDDIKEIIEKLAKTNVLVHTLADAFKQEREGAYGHRREIRETMGEIERRMSVVENHVRVVQTKLGEMNPTIEDYRQTKAEAAGAAKLAMTAANAAKALWAIGATIITAIITTIAWWLSKPPPPPPPPPSFPWGTL
jgi:methyl-accepting chemotaxis protein